MGWHDGMAMLMSVDMSNVHMFLVWMDLHNGKGCTHDIDGCMCDNMFCHFFPALCSSWWRPSIKTTHHDDDVCRIVKAVACS